MGRGWDRGMERVGVGVGRGWGHREGGMGEDGWGRGECEEWVGRGGVRVRRGCEG